MFGVAVGKNMSFEAAALAALTGKGRHRMCQWLPLQQESEGLCAGFVSQMKNRAKLQLHNPGNDEFKANFVTTETQGPGLIFY